MKRITIEVVMKDKEGVAIPLLTKEYDDIPTPTILYNELVAALKVRLLGK
tara:strand:+ start:2929 stop:3078 length:150 start_codon:yes stop_codon:yes gene_type:complete